MRTARQRQDVAFLALAVSTLAIAIAIMIGIRALSQKPKEKPKPVATAQAPPQTRAVPTPPASRKRDPFAEQARIVQAAKSGAKPEPEFRLVGIISARQPMAVIRRGARHYYVTAGQTIAGYSLAAIGRDRVTLVKGEERITLELRPLRPEEQEEKE